MAARKPSESERRRRVMVVHGRNLAARQAVVSFLLALGLRPVDWASAVKATGKGAPYNLEAVQAAMRSAQAVVVVFTAEDEARLLPSLALGADDEERHGVVGQPRPNVLVEAGLALALMPERTIIVEIGRIRRASDLDGLNALRLGNGRLQRWEFRDRLETAGCAVSSGPEYLQTGLAGDFEASVTSSERAYPTEASGLAVCGVQGRHLEAFRVTEAGRVEHSWFPDDGGRQRWEPWHDFFRHEPLASEISPVRDVGAVSALPDHLDVVLLHGDGSVRIRSWQRSGGWEAGLEELGQPFGPEGDARAIAVGSWRPGHIDVQVVSLDGERRNVWFDDGWHFADGARGWYTLPR